MNKLSMRAIRAVVAPLLFLVAQSNVHASAYQGKVVSVMAVNGGSQVLVTMLEGAWDSAPAAQVAMVG